MFMMYVTTENTGICDFDRPWGPLLHIGTPKTFAFSWPLLASPSDVVLILKSKLCIWYSSIHIGLCFHRQSSAVRQVLYTWQHESVQFTGSARRFPGAVQEYDTSETNRRHDCLFDHSVINFVFCDMGTRTSVLRQTFEIPAPKWSPIRFSFCFCSSYHRPFSVIRLQLRKKALTFLLCLVQITCTLWYGLSYVPMGQECFKSSVSACLPV